MTARWRVVLVAGGLVLLAALFVALWPTHGEEARSPQEPEVSPRTAETAPAETAPAETAPAEPPPPPPARPPARRFRVVVQRGRVQGGLRVLRAERGERVVIVVAADVADEVHLHGYDVLRRVGPGRPARLAFRASTPGRFELELHHTGLPLGELEVRP